MPAPAPTDGLKPQPRSSEPIVEAISLSSMAKWATRPDMDDLEDADLAYLTVRDVRALKHRLIRLLFR
jgi:hypothetical protein